MFSKVKILCLFCALLCSVALARPDRTTTSKRDKQELLLQRAQHASQLRLHELQLQQIDAQLYRLESDSPEFMTSNISQSQSCDLRERDVPILQVREEDDPVVRNALIAVYNATDGPNWNSNDYWLSNRSYCRWVYVWCFQNTTRVIGLRLMANGLRNMLPPEICHIASLEVLYVWGNSMTGPLPNCQANWTRLYQIFTGGNQLNISIRELDWVFTLPSINWIAISNCSISGTLPTRISPSLKLMIIYHNDFYGSIPDVYCQLVEIDGTFNRFTGALPSCLWRVYNIYLAHNRITGELPEPLGPLNPHSEIILANNKLYGQIHPAYLSVQLFDVHHNMIEGIPVMTELTTALAVEINLSQNLLSATPEVLNNLVKYTRATQLRLDSNKLYGPMPMDISADIRVLTLANNHLHGPLNYSLSGPLYYLDVSYNNFSGEFHVYTLDLRINIIGNLWMRNNPNAIYWYSRFYDISTRFGDNPDSFGELACYPIGIDTMLADVGPAYLDGINCVCATGFVGIPHGNITGCIRCPLNAICNSTYGDTVFWDRGFYPVFINGSAVSGLLPCASPDEAYRSDCKRGSYLFGSLPLPDYTELCTEGSTDRLCSRCLCDSIDNCLFRTLDNICESCMDIGTILLLLIPAIVFVFIAILVFILARYCWPTIYQKSIEGLDTITGVGTLKVLLIYIQTAAALNWMWPNWIATNGMQFLSLANARVTGLGLVCILPWLSQPSHEQLAYMLLLPAIFAVIGIFVGAHSVGSILVRQYRRLQTSARSLRTKSMKEVIVSGGEEQDELLRSHHDDREDEDIPKIRSEKFSWRWGVWAIISALYFFYFGMTSAALEPFNCVDNPYQNRKYMQSIPWIPCSVDSEEWTNLVILSAIMLSVYTVAIPILFMILLALYTKDSYQAYLKDMLGPLIFCYRSDRYWFELIIIARRLALAILISFVPQYEVYRPPLIMAVLVLSLGMQYLLRPFKQHRDNFLETVALSTTVITFAAQDTWQRQNAYNSPTTMLDYTSSVAAMGSPSANSDILINIMAVANITLIFVIGIIAGYPFILWLFYLLRTILTCRPIVPNVAF